MFDILLACKPLAVVRTSHAQRRPDRVENRPVFVPRSGVVAFIDLDAIAVENGSIGVLGTAEHQKPESRREEHNGDNDPSYASGRK